MRKNIAQSIIAILGVSVTQHAIAEDALPFAVEFEKPFRLKTASGKFIETTKGGHACPFYTDVTGDGKRDLLVGQITGGRISIYENLGKFGFADRKWIMDGDKPVEIADVW